MTNNDFYNNILKTIVNLNRKCPEQNIEGFSCSHVGETISVANTAEALMSLELMCNYRDIQNAYLNKFGYDDIKNLFRSRADELLVEKEWKVSDLAYCGIGLVLLKDEQLNIDEIVESLLSAQLKEGGWGNTSLQKQSDYYSTFIALEFLHRVGKKPPCPIWLKPETFRSDPKGIKIINGKGGNNQNSIEALTLALYMQKVYYNIAPNEEYLKYINSYFKKKTQSILNADFENWYEHPVSGYKIFAFGLAAQLCKDIDGSFASRSSLDYSKICENFNSKNDREIPIILEYLRLVKSATSSLDLFEADKNITNEKNDDVVVAIINTSISTTIISVIFFCVILYLVLYIFNQLKLEFIGHGIIEIIIALFIELVLNYFELFSKISKLYFSIIDRIKKWHNRKGDKNGKKDSEK